MAKRSVIKIDLEKCNGCGLCLPGCPEGAIQVIDGKARLISDLLCDGLGACLGQCPKGAISIEERDAQEYDEYKVMENIARQGRNVIEAHLKHLREHKQDKYYKEANRFLKDRGIVITEVNEPPLECRSKIFRQGCPGSREMDFRDKASLASPSGAKGATVSELAQWPVQLMLVSPRASYLNDADLLVAADCVPFAYADFHRDLLKGKILLVGCPKLDDLDIYKDKFAQIFSNNEIKSVTYAHMEVPCCFGLIGVIKSAIADSGKEVVFKEVTITIKGEKSG